MEPFVRYYTVSFTPRQLRRRVYLLSWLFVTALHSSSYRYTPPAPRRPQLHSQGKILPRTNHTISYMCICTLNYDCQSISLQSGTSCREGFGLNTIVFIRDRKISNIVHAAAAAELCSCVPRIMFKRRYPTFYPSP